MADDAFIGEIRIFGCNFAPADWALCNGQLLPLSQNTALFSLLGTTYGGDGKSTFALPDLRGRMPMHPGQGPGLSLHDLGETSGVEAVTLDSSQVPAHNHTLSGGNGPAQQSPGAGAPGQSDARSYHPGPSTATFDGMLQPSGGGQPHDNMSPYLVLNFCICMNGVFPSRS